MNRKEFLQSTFVAGLGTVLLPNLLACVPTRTLFDPLAVSTGNLSKIRGNISTYSNKGGTVGILETKDGFVVIDAQFPDSIQPFIDAVSQKGKPIEFLCNTHHHGDHTAGNIAFKNITHKIIAQKQVPELQKNAAISGNALDKQHYANILFDKEHSFVSGKEKISVYHFGGGHTFGDAIYHFEKDNIVHMGDLIFINMLPVFRVKDGSDFKNWISILEKVSQKFEKDTIFIFGHADKNELTTGNASNIVEMRNFLEASADYVRKSLAEGKSADQISENLIIPKFEYRKAINKNFSKTFVEGIAEQL